MDPKLIKHMHVLEILAGALAWADGRTDLLVMDRPGEHPEAIGYFGKAGVVLALLQRRGLSVRSDDL